MGDLLVRQASFLVIELRDIYVININSKIMREADFAGMDMPVNPPMDLRAFCDGSEHSLVSVRLPPTAVCRAN